MDIKTENILKQFKSHLKIKAILTFLCYVAIFGGIFVYIFYATKQSTNVQIITDYKKNKDNYKTQKIMTNPRISFEYNKNQLYRIEAKKAFHQNNSEAILYDVFAKGEIGNITAGELKIEEDGNRLIFTNNPILILNE